MRICPGTEFPSSLPVRTIRGFWSGILQELPGAEERRAHRCSPIPTASQCSGFAFPGIPSGSVSSAVLVLYKTHPSLLLLQLLSPRSLNHPHSSLFPCAEHPCWTQQLPAVPLLSGWMCRFQKAAPGQGGAEMVTHSPHHPGQQHLWGGTCSAPPGLHQIKKTSLLVMPQILWPSRNSGMNSEAFLSGWMKAMLLKGLNQTFINRY